MTDKPIDLSRYEGRTPGDWKVHNYGPNLENIEVLGPEDEGIATLIDFKGNIGQDALCVVTEANATFIADAPLLVAEVEALRAEVATLESSILEAVACRHETDELVTELAGALRRLMPACDGEFDTDLGYLCRWCCAEMVDATEDCESPTCPGVIARAALAKVKGDGNDE